MIPDKDIIRQQYDQQVQKEHQIYCKRELYRYMEGTEVKIIGIKGNIQASENLTIIDGRLNEDLQISFVISNKGIALMQLSYSKNLDLNKLMMMNSIQQLFQNAQLSQSEGSQEISKAIKQVNKLLCKFANYKRPIKTLLDDLSNYLDTLDQINSLKMHI
ncbi:hypothetical protein FGO68_gene721 [Halteria grandinella]|uniref:Uncharacterized protein n=1 Tax=Halteria grandinella TaxID=5974 RepID=A0A8J8NM07_HALGN|nr:hypothetical protein FGO68_gene721 [Halteria grandinella]